MAVEHKEKPSEVREKAARKRNHPEDADASAKKKHKHDKKKTIPEQEDDALATAPVVPVSFTAPTATVLSQKNLASPFSQIRTRIYIHLAPLWVGRAVDGVNEQLNAFLMRYVPQFDGVVLAHSNLKILQPNARIMYDSPYCHFWVTVDLLVWKPVKASKLVGTINLQSADHIGLLLYGTFNASIPREFIPATHYEWRPSSSPATPPPEEEVDPEGETEDSVFNRQRVQNGEWLVRATGEAVGATDGVVEFTVVDLVQANDMLTVTGALHPPAEKTEDKNKDKKEKHKEKHKKDKDKNEKGQHEKKKRVEVVVEVEERTTKKKKKEKN